MLGFVEDLVRESLAGVLEEVFYDSKACLCTFEFAPGFDLKGHIAEIVLSCAKAIFLNLSGMAAMNNQMLLMIWGMRIKTTTCIYFL